MSNNPPTAESGKHSGYFSFQGLASEKGRFGCWWHFSSHDMKCFIGWKTSVQGRKYLWSRSSRRLKLVRWLLPPNWRLRTDYLGGGAEETKSYFRLVSVTKLVISSGFLFLQRGGTRWNNSCLCDKKNVHGLFSLDSLCPPPPINHFFSFSWTVLLSSGQKKGRKLTKLQNTLLFWDLSVISWTHSLCPWPINCFKIVRSPFQEWGYATNRALFGCRWLEWDRKGPFFPPPPCCSSP